VDALSDGGIHVVYEHELMEHGAMTCSYVWELMSRLVTILSVRESMLMIM
jgi:hypothetical protein